MNTMKVKLRGGLNIAPNTVDAPVPTIDNVRTVYSGAHGCMCGCLGKHKANPKFADEAGSNRGYSFDEEDISQRSVKTVITKLLKAGAMADEGNEKSYLFAETPSRVYVVYFTDAVRNG